MISFKKNIYKNRVIEEELTPINCVVSAWSAWSDCIESTRTRTRTIITPASNGGVACPILLETEECIDFQCFRLFTAEFLPADNIETPSAYLSYFNCNLGQSEGTTLMPFTTQLFMECVTSEISYSSTYPVIGGVITDADIIDAIENNGGVIPIGQMFDSGVPKGIVKLKFGYCAT